MLGTYTKNEAESLGLKTLARAGGIAAHASVLSPSRSGTTRAQHFPGSSFCLSVPLLPLFFLSKSRLLTERRQDWEQTQKVQSGGGW